MQAAQVLKTHREAVESRREEDYREENEENLNNGFDAEEDEVLIQVPKYLQGVPLVDAHSENSDETYIVIQKNLAGILQVNRFSSSKSCYLFGPRNKLRKFTCYIITHQIFEFVILITILTNCIFLALNRPPKISEYVFAIIYTIEMLLKVVAKGFVFQKYAYLRNSWNWLDFICVMIGYLTFIPSISNISVVRTFRALRALRTISAVKGLKAMVNTLMKSIKMLSDVMILTGFFICVFALIGLQLFKGTLRNKCIKHGFSLDSEDDWHLYVNNKSNWLINNDFPFVCGNSSYAGHCPKNYTCIKDVGENPPKSLTPFISFDNFLWSLLTSLQLVTLDSWEFVYNSVIGANGQMYVLYFLFVVLLGPFYLINLVLAVVSLSYEIESAALQDEEKMKENYAALKRSASTYDFDCKEMPEPLYLDDIPQRPDAHVTHTTEPQALSRSPTPPTSHNALDLFEHQEQRISGCFSGFRAYINKIVESSLFEGFITTCILLNTLCMALEHHGMNKTFAKVLETCNLTFTKVFILEMILKLTALGIKKYLSVAWNLFDGVIGLMSIVDMSMYYSKESSGAGGALSVLRTFRLLRVLKLAKSWKTMGNLLATIGKSVGAVGNITVILLILMFIFAVVGMQVFSSSYTTKKFEGHVPRWNFKDFPRSFMMVFRIICGKWIEPCWDVMHASHLLSFIYVILVFILGQWIVLNLFLALLLSSFGGDSLEEEKEKQAKQKKKKSFLEIFRRKKKRKITPNASNQDLDKSDEDIKKAKETEAGLNLSNGGDTGNGNALRKDENACSDTESLVNVTRTDGEMSQPSFPLSVVVDEALARAKNVPYNPQNEPIAPYNPQNEPKECLNVANRNGAHAVPNGNSHKESNLNLDLQVLGFNPTLVNLNGDKRESMQSSMSIMRKGRTSSTRSGRRPTMIVIGEDGAPVAPNCYPTFCYDNGTCFACCKCYRTSKTRKLWTTVRTKINFFVEHKYFESFILFLIVVSSLSLAFEDVHLKKRPTLQKILHYSNYFFAVAFALEFLLKLIGYGVVGYFTSFWNLLDVSIVAISIATLFGNENLNALRSLRALRPLRAVSKFEGMKVVINSLVLSLPAIGNVVLVCLVFWLIFSIMGVQFFGGKFHKCVYNESGERYPPSVVPMKENCTGTNRRWINSKIHFDNALAGFLALFQVATLEGYMEVIFDSVDATKVNHQPKTEAHYEMNFFYVVFITLGSFFILNLFIGVIIENFSKLKQQYEDSDAMGIFLTPNQRIWVNTVSRTYMKKPRKQPKRPKVEWRGKVYDLVQSRSFEFVIMAIITLNILTMMGEHHGQSEKFTEGLTYLNYIFTALFVIEAVLRVIALMSAYFRSGWNLFDFTIVMFSITEIVLESYKINMPFSPGLLRVVRVFRLARLLRFFESAKGIRSLLFALLKSLPGLANIGCLLFLFMFIYACIGMSLWGNVKQTGYIDDVVNFKTFFSSLLLLFRIATAAGWNTILEPMMIQPPDCDDKFNDIPNGNCGDPLLAVVYFVSYILLIFLVTVNMYIAVILENFNEAQQQDEIGLCEEDMDAFIAIWEIYDPEATQFIHYRDLTHFLDALDPPLKIAKPNEQEAARLDVAIRQGNMIHCLDLMLALVRKVIGNMEELTEDDKENMYEKFEDRFQSSFPQRKTTPILCTINERYVRETAATIKLQRAFRKWQCNNQTKWEKEKFHKHSSEEKIDKNYGWEEKQINDNCSMSCVTRPHTASSPRKKAPLEVQETFDSPVPQSKKDKRNNNYTRETGCFNDPNTTTDEQMYFNKDDNKQKQQSSESAV